MPPRSHWARVDQCRYQIVTKRCRMAGLQNRNGSWRVLFWHQGKQHNYLIGEVTEAEAKRVASRVDYWLMRLKQNLVRIPAGSDVVAFMRHDGNPPAPVAATVRKELTLAQLRDAYVTAQEGKLERTTLDG